MYEEIAKVIGEAKNICLIPSENEPESLPAVLALFYTLRESGKNVNLIADEIPEKFNFLIPSPEFVNVPKNFVISIPRSAADISQIYYEKTEENLKIYLTAEKGRIKKENVAFYFSEPKPDLIITLGIKNLQKYFVQKLDLFGFLLDAPILNVDFSHSPEESGPQNALFGKINIIESGSLSEITLRIINSAIGENFISSRAANCLLAGLALCYENFKNPKTHPEVFDIAARLMRRGADYEQITEHLNKTGKNELKFLSRALWNIKNENNVSVSVIDSEEFENFDEPSAITAGKKIKNLGVADNVLVMWKSRSSEPNTKGFFASKNPLLTQKIAENYGGFVRNGMVFFSMQEVNIHLVKEKILKLLA